MAQRMSTVMKRARSELRTHPTPKRIRATLGEQTVLDTTDALLVWEPRRVVPVYAVSPGHLHVDLEPIEALPIPDPLPPILPPSQFALHTSPGTSFTLRHDGIAHEHAAFRPDDPDLGGRLLLDWNAFDAWFEEEQPVVGHPHDPFARIDILSSARTVVVEVDGTTLASSSRPLMLIETGLPVRYYLPREDVRLDLLTPSDARTTCAYKGHASYWTYQGVNVAWTYQAPLPEVAVINNLIAFYAERTTLTVDGVQEHGFALMAAEAP